MNEYKRDVLLSSKSMTICVTVLNEKIIEAPPIVKKFVGQKFDNLFEWFKKTGGPIKLSVISCNNIESLDK